MNQDIQEFLLPAGKRLIIVLGDLTEEHVDAIVNAANSHLSHGGGVAGAISRRGGPQIQAESDAWVLKHGPVSHNEPAYTRGGALPCDYVIHAVGPIWGEGNEDAKLAAATHGSLKLADKLAISTIAFPAISTGIFGFPKSRAAGVILVAIQEYLLSNPASNLKLVRITLIDRSMAEVFIQVAHSMGFQGTESDTPNLKTS